MLLSRNQRRAAPSSAGSGSHREAAQGKGKEGGYMEIEEYSRQFSANPRRFQKFHLRISWLIYMEALFLQSMRRLTLIQH